MKPETPQKRIPNGTRVMWRARYETDPMHEGVVQEFVPLGATPRNGETWEKNLGAPHYRVLVDRTANGLPKKNPIVMRPYASRLEAQNPEALKVVP